MLFSSSGFSNGWIFRLKFLLPTCIIFIPTWVSTQRTYSQGSMKAPSSVSLLLLQVTWFVPSFSPMQQMGAAAALHNPHECLCFCIQCRPHVWTSASFLGCSGEAHCTLSKDLPMNFCVSGSFVPVTIWVPCRESCPSRRDLKLPPVCRQVWKNMQVGIVDCIGCSWENLRWLRNRKYKLQRLWGRKRIFPEETPQSVSSHILKWACSPLWWQQQQSAGHSVQGTWKLYIFSLGDRHFCEFGTQATLLLCDQGLGQSREAQMMQWSTWPQCVRPRLWTRGEWGDDGSHGDQSGIEKQGTMKALDKGKIKSRPGKTENLSNHIWLMIFINSQQGGLES